MKNKYNQLIAFLKDKNDFEAINYLNSLTPLESATLTFMAQRSGRREEGQLVGDLLLSQYAPKTGQPVEGVINVWK